MCRWDNKPNSIQLLSKLSAYGWSENSTQLLSCYLSGRKQQIKLGNTVSTWAIINKGVPQESILGLCFLTYL